MSAGNWAREKRWLLEERFGERAGEHRPTSRPIKSVPVTLSRLLPQNFVGRALLRICAVRLIRGRSWRWSHATRSRAVRGPSGRKFVRLDRPPNLTLQRRFLQHSRGARALEGFFLHSGRIFFDFRGEIESRPATTARIQNRGRTLLGPCLLDEAFPYVLSKQH